MDDINTAINLYLYDMNIKGLKRKEKKVLWMNAEP